MTSFEEFRSRFGPDRHDADGQPMGSGSGRSYRNSWAVRAAAMDVLAGVAALAVTVVFGPSSAPRPPAFLQAALGAKSDAPSERVPAKGVKVTLGEKTGFAMTAPALSRTSPAAATAKAARPATVRASIVSTAAEGGAWQSRSGGAVRSTPFGSEAVVVGPRKTEQFLTVAERQGQKTWSWKIDSTIGWPRVGDDGYIAFIDSRRQIRQDIVIPPVEILDAAGEKVTPKGLKW